MPVASRNACRFVEILTLVSLLGSPIPAEAASPDRSSAVESPDPATIRRYGPAYRYPRSGWIVLHVEGTPYDRGYQHGRLLAYEIGDYIKTLATKRSQKDPGFAWGATRSAVNALFLRGFEPEYLEEMKGIADGASAAGASFQGRPLDLLDLAAVNAEIELEFLDDALLATPTGLESRTFREPHDRPIPPAPPEHCSAFAATGPATADGRIVFGHITMFSQYFVRHFNVWLDIKPEKGHRVLMQTYPGGIQSGMDYYMNDAGLIVAETTVKQTRFHKEGRPLASRIRKALQYADSIDGVVAALREGNNGLYTNEWLIADTKTNEIAMFELGTHKSKLWRSSRDEWFGGTRGFYWGCNNVKDLAVRLETIPALDGKPSNAVFHPSDRDRTWLRLYEKHKGKINEAFGFEAFTTPPLAAFHSLDAKFTTTDMAKGLKTWAIFGPPRGKTWEIDEDERSRFPEAVPLVSNDWTILTAEPPPSGTTGVEVAARNVKAGAPSSKREQAVDLDLLAVESKANSSRSFDHPPAWHGTILPESDADLWLASAFAEYEPIVAADLAARPKSRNGSRTQVDRARQAFPLFGPYSRYRTAVSRLGRDVPLDLTKPEFASDAWYGIASGKGILLLHELRQKLGDERFVKMMDRFGREFAGRPATTAAFRKAATDAASGQDLKAFFDEWLTNPGLPSGISGDFWAVNSFESDLDRTVIVYGTRKESDAQREAAQRLQRQIERRWANQTVPILAETEATPDALKGRHVLLVGRPETNRLAARFKEVFPAAFGPASFVIGEETYAHPRSALIVAGPNPDDPRSSLVLFAGLSAEATYHCVEKLGPFGTSPAAAIVLPAGRPAIRLGQIERPESLARAAAP